MDRCLNCMQEITSGLCPYCGYNISAYEPQSGALKPQTLLKGRYYTGRVLGRGGFGITYNGWDAQTGRRVAIKEYFPSGLAIRMEDHNTISAVSSVNTHTYKSGVVKFYDEAQILTEFRDVKEIVEIYDFFYENETSYIVMEYVEGENICQIMTRLKRMDTETAAGIILKLTDAMIKVHAQDVLHRDISPSNILITEDGGIKLIDFGSARQFALDQSNSMSVILKNGFAPIEQYSRKGNHGPWTDIYSICATFYYMIAGKMPEQATDRLIDDTLIPPSKLGAYITPKQEAVLFKGLAVKAKDRYQTASELKSAIEKAFGNHPVTTRPIAKEEQKTVALEEEPVPVHKEKKVLSIPIIITAVCIAIIILTMLSLTIYKSVEIIASGTCGANATWSLYDDGELIISGKGNMNNYTFDSSISSYNIPWEKYLDIIKTIDISDGITSIGENAFTYCDVLTHITIPNSVTNIGNSAFNCCIKLTNVTIPNSVIYIGDFAFYGCKSINKITIPDSVTNIGFGTFIFCASLTSINVDSDNLYYTNDEHGVLYNINKTKLIVYPNGNKLRNFSIPNNVTYIYDCAFGYCNNLTNITIPDSVTYIGYNVFVNCTSITNITIPNSVTYIGAVAFGGCDSLTIIYIKGLSNTPSGWDSGWNNSCNAIIKWNQ